MVSYVTFKKVGGGRGGGSYPPPPSGTDSSQQGLNPEPSGWSSNRPPSHHSTKGTIFLQLDTGLENAQYLNSVSDDSRAFILKVEARSCQRRKGCGGSRGSYLEVESHGGAGHQAVEVLVEILVQDVLGEGLVRIKGLLLHTHTQNTHTHTSEPHVRDTSCYPGGRGQAAHL